MKRLTLRTAVGLGFVLLLINTGYIAAFATPSIPYMMNVLAHFVGGLALAGAFAWLLKREPDLRRPLAAAAILFAISIVFALYLVAVGNLREHSWVLWTHIITATLGVVAVLPFAFRLVRSTGRPRTLGMSVQSAVAFAAVLPLATSVYFKSAPDPRHRIVNPTTAPLSMEGEGGGPGSPFFPSSAKTNVGGIIPSNFFMDSQACGECHKDIFDQWNSSAHHFASFNNQFYRKSIEYMQEVVGPQPSKWCAGCHDHAVFFNGRFERPIKDQIDTPEAQAGLACTSCHAITEVRSTMGQGDFTIEYPALHELMTSKNPFIKTMDRFMTYLNPEPHRRTFIKPFMTQDQSEFCSTCHKVHLDVPVNGYRWFRGFNDYDAWQASGVSGQGARSFYYPPKSLTCVDCHMPLVDSKDPGRHADGKIHNHRFPAANTALAHVNKDEAQMKITKDFLQSGFIKVDIFAASPIDESKEATPMIRRAQEAPQLMTAFGVGEEAEQHGPIVIRDVGQVAAPLNKAQPVLAPGSVVRLDVVVRTVRIGHFFPGGTIDAFDVWLELQGRDADGRMIFWSGAVEDEGKGPVEKGAHLYRALQLDGKGNAINKRNAWQARSVQYVRLIPPGAADVAHYRVRIPKDARGPITFTAKLNYRKFAHFYTQFAYAGLPKPGQDASLLNKSWNSLEYSFDKANVPKNVSGQIKDEIPNLPIIELATATVSLPVGDGKTPTKWEPMIQKADYERWNDWGIGMLLQGDLKGAEYAFKTVTQAHPAYADGWLNVARSMIQEGETEAAKPFVQKALDIDSSLGRIHFFKAMIEKADGDYPAAIASLRRVVQQYPRDRVALNQLGRVLFLSREYAEALTVLERVSLVDPEDLQMHYTSMLVHRGLGNAEEAARSEKLFQRFKAEESAQAITGDRRRASPEENNERQQIHEHESIPLPVFDRSKTVLTNRQAKSNSRVGGNN
jgi:tetratricopeptide (TPR) repeat protein